MAVKHLNVDDLCRVAGMGGGLRIYGPSFSVDDLARIAGMAKGKKASIIVEGSARFDANEMARIAGMGGGCVIFE